MESKEPLVSIALCTYNGERFLKQQLDSLVSQSYPNLEIIAVDDRSTDLTLSILNEYKTRYHFLKVFQNERNLGFRENFEKALSYTTGDFIALCDQDDIWHVDKVKIQVENIGDNILFYHDSAFIDEHGHSLGKNLSDVMYLYRGNQCHHFLLENCLSGHTCFFKRSLLQHILPLPPHLYHDKWIGFVATSLGNIDYSAEALVNYRQHTSSTTDILRNKKTGKKNGLLKIKDLNAEIKILKDHLPGDSFIGQFYFLLMKRMDQYISFKLFLFVYRNRNILYYFKRSSALSKFSYSLKFLWGYRLKALLTGEQKY
jgi:glycosyltransferase involved in cell wall biosynthesis